jgi:hypothetical protein
MNISFKQFSQFYDTPLEELTEERLDEIFGMFKNSDAAKKALADRKKREEDEAAQAAKKRMTVPQYREFLKREISRTKSSVNATVKDAAGQINDRKQQAIDRAQEFGGNFQYEEKQ